MMVIEQLRFMAWNALVLMRVPIRAFFIIMGSLCLLMALAGVVSIPFGRVGDAPVWAHLVACVVLLAGFAIWSGLAYFYDTAIFRLTPKDREIILAE